MTGVGRRWGRKRWGEDKKRDWERERNGGGRERGRCRGHRERGVEESVSCEPKEVLSLLHLCSQSISSCKSKRKEETRRDEKR